MVISSCSMQNMSLPLVPLRVKKQEKYLAKNLANTTHFNVEEIEGLFHMYRHVFGTTWVCVTFGCWTLDWIVGPKYY